MKKYISVILAILCLVPFFALSVQADSPSVSAKSAVLIEAESGKILYMKNAFIRLPMASTTKIMTALVAIESGDIDREVDICDEAIGTEGSSVYLAKGEVLTLRQLLYALMLASANDAAIAIAYEVGGSIEGFTRLMNQKAEALGLTSTHFTNPHGLHHEEHYTTAYELALITKAALQNEVFLEICSSKSATIPLCGGEGTRYLSNHNKLLRSYKGAIGVKTGFTKASGRCLVSAAERDGLRLIAVTLNAPDDWRDHSSMLDFGFERYKNEVFAQKGEFIAELDISGGSLPTVIAANLNELSACLPTSHGELTYITEVNRPIFAPVKSGSVLGRVRVFCDGTEVASSPLVALVNVEIYKTKHSFMERLKALFQRRTLWKK